MSEILQQDSNGEDCCLTVYIFVFLKTQSGPLLSVDFCSSIL